MARMMASMLVMVGGLVLLRYDGVTLVHGQGTTGACSNLCSGHGNCNNAAMVCECHEGWGGGDCSMKLCPYGRAWADQPSSTDTAHAMMECSNKGLCDYALGVCTCEPGYEGLACERMSCQLDCNGHGACKSMHYNALEQTVAAGKLGVTEYGCDKGSCVRWDAHKIFGCVCDKGYSGHDCSLRDCPVGDDPLTAGQRNEIQLLLCKTPNHIDGTSPHFAQLNAAKRTFTLTWNGLTTIPLLWSVTAADLQLALSAITSNDRSVGNQGVKVAYTSGGVTDPACGVDSNGVQNVISVEYLQDFGPLTRIVPGGNNELAITVISYDKQKIPIKEIIVASGVATAEITQPKRTIAVGAPISIRDNALDSLNKDVTVTQVVGSDSLKFSWAAQETDGTNIADGTYFGGTLECIEDPDGTLNGLYDHDGDANTAGEPTPGITYHKGNKESMFCSNRGLCDTLTGICSCYTNYQTSNGIGAPGQRGDCGSAMGGITACPGAGLSCSGHGVCSNSPSYVCMCANGWMGGDCSERTCPSGKEWFGAPDERHAAHVSRECSNKGICDRTKGECKCAPLFEGSACERMSCPSTGCSGHGKCLDMSQLALASTAHNNGAETDMTYGKTPNDPPVWDYNKAQGCLCDPGYEGYDCSQFSCPKGDDPHTGFGNGDEVQNKERIVLRCTGTGGTWRLQFRTHQTAELSYKITAPELQAALEALPNVGKVKVEYVCGKVDPPNCFPRYGKTWYEDCVIFGVCNTYGDPSFIVDPEGLDPKGTAITPKTTVGYDGACTIEDAPNPQNEKKIMITFLSDHGALPAFKIDTSTLYPTDGRLTIEQAHHSGLDITGINPLPTAIHGVKTVEGTQERITCSGRGLCDLTQGSCTCFSGYGSSDGSGKEGTRKDCGYLLPVANGGVV